MAAIMASSTAPPFVIFMPFILIVAGIVNALTGMSKASAHERAEAAYQTRRRSLLRELEGVQRGG